MPDTTTAVVYTPERICEELQRAWQQPGAGISEYRSAPYRPIAGSTEDQTSPDGTNNPLWDVVRWMPAEPYWPTQHESKLEPTYVHSAFSAPTAHLLHELGANRDHLAAQYAWSIITPSDTAWIVDQLAGRAVVEVGAGTGYWAWQLEQAGVDVAAYDPHPPSQENKYCTAGPYTTVLIDGATAVTHHQDRALLMVWPPYGGEHARHALSLYEGDLLLYAGEGSWGCTADEGFYELLEAEWDETSVAPAHVTWWGIHCRLAAYRRKGHTLTKTEIHT